MIFYFNFDINNFTGVGLTREKVLKKHYKRIQFLQLISFKYFPEKLKIFSLLNVSSIEKRKMIQSHLSQLTNQELHRLANLINIIDENQTFPQQLLLEAIIFMHEKRISQLEAIDEIPIYPNETLLWKSIQSLNGVPSDEDESDYDDSDNPFHSVLPKLNLQFLTLYDYLLRNFYLYQTESIYQIREDIEDSVKRLAPRQLDNKKTTFTGWSRMSTDILEFSLKQVDKPKIGKHI